MRQIKFRGKTLSGEWAYGSLIKLDIGYIILTNEVAETSDESDERDAVIFSADEIAAVIPETVGQFTGLLDKNGIEIYEGDIIKISKHEIPGIIKWDNLRLCFLCEWTNMPTAGDIGYLVNNCLLEVVGTVFDNPELLKGASHD